MSNFPEETLRHIEETANFLKQNGRGSLDYLTAIYKNDPAYSFLFPESPYYPFFMQQVEAKLQGTNTHSSYDSHEAYPPAPPANVQPNKPPSRWNMPASYQNASDSSGHNISPQHGQMNIQYNVPQQGNQYITPNMPSNVNQAYPNYFSNQAQAFNNLNYNQTAPHIQQQGNMMNMGNAANLQTMQRYPNYSSGNNQNPPPLYGNNNPVGFLPNYNNPIPQPPFQKNERRSSIDKSSGGMDSESPRNKVPRQYNTPEDVPVGVMADMLKQQAKKYKERNMNLKPYTPLDPDQTPQVIPAVSKVSETVKTKIEFFYKFLKDEREIEKAAEKRKSTDIDLEILKAKNQPARKPSDFLEGFAQKSAVPDYQELINSEMGVRANGQSIMNIPGGGDERKGLGTSRPEDIYSSFRKQRSNQYHVFAEERVANRQQPELCYVCRMPGHLARDCKFGLT